jgi:hypothetical protein
MKVKESEMQKQLYMLQCKSRIKRTFVIKISVTIDLTRGSIFCQNFKDL